MKIQPPAQKRGHQPRRATAAVELAVVMPLIIILLTGLLEVGRMVQISEILNNAAREGAAQSFERVSIPTQMFRRPSPTI